MNPSKIGIIGGAGPSAGGLLFEQLIKHCQNKYGCKRDHEFPHVTLVNYPFSDMLSYTSCLKKIRNEIDYCIKDLKGSGCDIIAIACNTLHLFIGEFVDDIIFVHMIEETKKAVSEKLDHRPIVLCSSTSSKNNLHKSYFDCEYVASDIQKKLDSMISDITEGKSLPTVSQEISTLISANYQNVPIVLGCTEFSYLHEKYPFVRGIIYDPSNIVAEKMADLYYAKQIPHRRS